MGISIQRRGGNTVASAAFVGAARELSIDTSNNVLVVHDGSKPGGYYMAGVNVAQQFLKGQSVLPFSNSAVNGNISLDFSVSNNFELKLTANTVVLLNPSYARAGTSGYIIVREDSVGSRAMSYGNAFLYSAATSATFNTSANATNVIGYYVADYNNTIPKGNIHLTFSADSRN